MTPCKSQWWSGTRCVVGWLGATFGSLGVVLCLVGLVGVWLVNARIRAPLTRAVDSVRGLVAEVRSKAGEVHDGMGDAREAVGGIEERIHEGVQDALTLSAEELVQLAGLEEEVRRGVERVTYWIAVAESAAVLLDEVVNMVESIVGAPGDDTVQERSLTEWVEVGKADLAQAVALLDAFHIRLIELRPGPLDGPLRGPLQEGIALVDAKLAAIQDQIVAFGGALEAVEERVAQLHQRIRGWLRLVAVVLSGLLLWQLAAQASLAVHGWGWGRRR